MTNIFDMSKSKGFEDNFLHLNENDEFCLFSKDTNCKMKGMAVAPIFFFK